MLTTQTMLIIPTDIAVKDYVFKLHSSPADGILFDSTLAINVDLSDISESNASSLCLDTAKQEIELTILNLNASELTKRGIKRLISFIQSYGSKRYRVTSFGADSSVVMLEDKPRNQEDIFSDWIQALDLDF